MRSSAFGKAGLFPLFFTFLFLASGCYRLPTSEDYSTIPHTNNPDVTCEKRKGALPAIAY